MADTFYFLNVVDQEDSSDGMEDRYGKADDQQMATPLDELFQHATDQDVSKRQMAGKMLINILQNAVDSKLRVLLDEIFQPVEQLVYDKAATVRSSLVECLPHVVIICNEAPDLFCGNLTSRILNIVLLYLGDPVSQVRLDAQTALKMLLERELLDDDQIEQGVCSTIVKFSQSDDQDLNIMALTLMAKINMYISIEFMEQVFLDRFLELCSNENALIRKECASVMGEFCKLMSKESIYNKLLPVYTNLCLDNAWNVRRNAADMMMSMTRCVPLSIRRNLLSKLLDSHLNDESRWVRYSAYEILGPFISTFAKQFHELIFDQKGELVLVHESDRGWPRFNVVPVVQSHTFSKVLFDDVGVIDDYSKMRRSYFDKTKKFRKQNHSNEKFNLFQYYYNPPDMPLDPELVNSVIESNVTQKDNDANTQPEEQTKNSENQVDRLEDVNKNANTEDKSQEQDAEKENIDLKDQQKDNNQNNENLTSEENTEKNKNNESDENTDNNENNENNENSKNSDMNENIENTENVENKNNESSESDENKESHEVEESNQNKESTEKVEENKHEINVLRITDLDEERKTDVADHLSSPKSPARVVNTTYNFNDTLSLSNNSFDHSTSFELSNYRMLLLSSLKDIMEEEADDNEVVPEFLIRHFISMVDLQLPLNGIDKDLDYHCAYCFPAVVLTLGKDKWHELLSAYQKMAESKKWNVRSTLACSIHEIAIIIQKYLAARDLVPIFNGFIQDLEEVRIGALKHLSTFLRVLSPKDRLQYLPKFNTILFSIDNRNWRLREELAKQLCYIIHLYKPFDVAVHIAPLVLHIMQDKVAAVRQEAMYTVARTVAYLSFNKDGTVASGPCNKERARIYQNNKDNGMAVTMIREMRDMMRRAGHWVIRQNYVLACSKLASESVISGELFANELLGYLLELSFDKVANVRIVVARTLSRDILCMPDFPKKHLDEVKQKLKDMQMDSDRDVRFFAGGE